ncbi:hypothetical protein Metal_1339 [Methylomicrobium album BG8]|uniref:SAM-dependent methyltransferase n=1 Tax=Methylomicrobium album BG8 TaxID=686340 RepID=H8GJE6_METAL|nr:hypothetical protein Metal_1339 [Methylomicrobium album BG8]
MELSSVIHWGRSLSEYKAMFSLSNHDLGKKILGCGDGPASFNAELTEQNGHVISVDPIYRFNANQIRARIDEVYSQVVEQVSKNKDDYVWKHIPHVEALGKVRMQAMRLFLADYGVAKESGRYLNASLPTLPFDDGEFEIALCSHYLFLYSEHVNQSQHILSMKELCRIAKEVRVYPLLSLSDNQTSPHLKPVIAELEADGISVDLVEVGYEFQKGATKMLVAKSV